MKLTTFILITTVLLMTVKYLNVNTYRYYCSNGELDIFLNKLLISQVF